jgi:putative sigma-54 modulation protein
VFDKVTRQAQKLKSRWTERKRQGISPAKAASAAPRPERGGRGFGERRRPAPRPEAGDNDELRIIRARRYAVKPMSIDEAAMEIADGRDAFLVFRDSSNDAVMVLYRRPDGNLGLIEPEA